MPVQPEIVLDLSCLYSTVKNTSGQAKFFGFLPPHGKKLAAAEEYSVFGSILEAVVRHHRATDRRQQQGLAQALNNGDITLVKTPAPFLQDTVTSLVKIIQLTSGSLVVADPCFTASDSESDIPA